MRKILTLAAVGVLFSCVGLLQADEKGTKVTLTGDGLCAKCALKETKTCQNVVIVTKNGKKTSYYLDAKNDFSKKAHAKLGFCSASKDEPAKVKVVGLCEKIGDKLVVTPTEDIKKDE